MYLRRGASWGGAPRADREGGRAWSVEPMVINGAGRSLGESGVAAPAGGGVGNQLRHRPSWVAVVRVSSGGVGDEGPLLGFQPCISAWELIGSCCIMACKSPAAP